MNSHHRKGIVAAAVAAVAVLGTVSTDARAQESSDEIIEEVIVTGVPRGGATKLEASVSVSALPAEEMINLAPRSTAEIFRSHPGRIVGWRRQRQHDDSRYPAGNRWFEVHADP